MLDSDWLTDILKVLTVVLHLQGFEAVPVHYITVLCFSIEYKIRQIHGQQINDRQQDQNDKYFDFV